MLSFSLSSQIQAVISIQGLIKVITVETASLTPMPDVSPVVMGIYNHGREIVWIVDLPYLLELTPVYSANVRQVYSIFILREGNYTIGFAVPEVGQILTLKESDLQPDYPNLGASQFNWCVDGLYVLPVDAALEDAQKTTTLVRLQRTKIFELLKIREMAV